MMRPSTPRCRRRGSPRLPATCRRPSATWAEPKGLLADLGVIFRPHRQARSDPAAQGIEAHRPNHPVGFFRGVHQDQSRDPVHAESLVQARLSSVFTLTAFSLPASSCESFLTAGATIRQGPHQGAQKSIRTGIGLFSTTELNSEVLL